MKIQLDNVSVSLGHRKVLNNIGISLDHQELVMAIGLNGTGKTTLIKTMLGFIPPEKGTVLYDGRDRRDIPLRESARMVAYLPQQQDHGLQYSVSSFVLMGVNPYLRPLEQPGKKEREKVAGILEEFNMSHLKDRRMDRISGGERQLAYLARARMQGARWLLLDEPTAGLDYLKQHWLMKWLRLLADDRKQGILLSVHNPELVLKYAQRVLILNGQGSLISISRTEEGFGRRLTKELNEIYEDTLELVEDGSELYYRNRA